MNSYVEMSLFGGWKANIYRLNGALIQSKIRIFGAYNFFRQDHGYKDGSYIKIWQGQEDNVHLVDILASAD
ncbi:MAG: hypothetical protein ACI87Q_000741, partial [Pseudohongiellaceae bacterium]